MNVLTISLPMLLFLAGIYLQRPAEAQAAQQTFIDVSRLGPPVGERVPDFNLKDQNGRAWTLDSIMGPNGAMLVFNRSADW